MFLIGSSVNFLPFLLTLTFSIIFCIEGDAGISCRIVPKGIEKEISVQETYLVDFVTHCVKEEVERNPVSDITVNIEVPVILGKIQYLLLFPNGPRRAPPIANSF